MKLLDEFGAVFRGAGEFQVTDGSGLEAGFDQFEQGDKLAENENLLAFVAELFEPLKEGVEFSAGQFAVRGGNQCRVAADLAQTQETR